MTRNIMTRFSLLAGAVVMTGCATVCETPECRQERVAKELLAHPTDVGVRAIGARTLIKIHPQLAVESEQVRKALIPQSTECQISAVREEGGKKVFVCTPVDPTKAPAP